MTTRSSARLRRTVLWLAAGGTILSLACSHGGPVPAPRDPSRGEYYTEDELRRLPAGDLDRYCSFMETRLREMKVQTAALKGRLDSLTVLADSLRTRQVEIGNRTREISARVRELRLREKATNTYVVVPGDNLRKIARTVYGDGTRWREIYLANQRVIGAEDAELKAGTRLSIPRQAEEAQ